MSEQNSVPSWVKKRQEEQETEQKNRSKFFKFPKGETIIEIDMNTPVKTVEKTFKGTNRTRYQYQIKVDGDIKTLECGSQLDTQIIDALIKNINPMTVIRIGSGIDTQYSIKELS